MLQPEDRNSIHMPLFSGLRAIASGEHADIRHFNSETLFWSLTRLFGHYERIMSVIDLPRGARPFLDSDLESFIVRFRVVLNDLAYSVRLMLPPNIRGFGPPKGGVHPKNREMSIFKLTEFLKSNSVDYPELAPPFMDALPWMTRLKNDRDNVIHYKAKAEVYEGIPLTFALSNPAGTERRTIGQDGEMKLVLTPIDAFVDEQMMSLYVFMNVSLLEAIKAYSARSHMKLGNGGSGFRISGPGIARFRTRNNQI